MRLFVQRTSRLSRLRTGAVHHYKNKILSQARAHHYFSGSKANFCYLNHELTAFRFPRFVPVLLNSVYLIFYAKVARRQNCLLWRVKIARFDREKFPDMMGRNCLNWGAEFSRFDGTKLLDFMVRNWLTLIVWNHLLIENHGFRASWTTSWTAWWGRMMTWKIAWWTVCNRCSLFLLFSCSSISFSWQVCFQLTII